jgi:hypothetical protein
MFWLRKQPVSNEAMVFYFGTAYTAASCFSIRKQALFLDQPNEDSCLVNITKSNTQFNEKCVCFININRQILSYRLFLCPMPAKQPTKNATSLTLQTKHENSARA